ncbi:MAG: metalloregulator ArsR/SmtB family transcription factor [Nitrospinota bacterium]|nr:metalloregulator ArsR/SmtB family transcription factor [Nitrospinota bacterium]
MEDLAKIFKMLSDKNRLRIIGLLLKRKMCVCELAFVLGVTQPSVSRHLKLMKGVGLVSDEKDRFWTNYFINCQDPKAAMILKYIKGWFKDNQVILDDLERLKGVDRKNICGC